MPISFRPNAKVWIWLDSDAAIEESKRPMFQANVLTCEQADAWFDTLHGIIDRKVTYGEMVDILLQHITGWINFPEPFSAVAMRQRLTRGELWELASQLVTKIGTGEDDLKKSVLQSQSNGAASASPASAGSATTPQANANLS